MKRSFWAVCLSAACASAGAGGRRDPDGFEDGSDLEYFVTRPDLRPPRYMVSNVHPESVSDGYWFVTPYTSLKQGENPDRKEHIPCQTGPAIYDGNGTLIWTGACKYNNRHVFNFKPIMMGGVPHLKYYLPPDKTGDHDVESGIILNNQYEEIRRTTLPGDKRLDSHEFRPQPNGKHALITTNWNTDLEAVDLDQGERQFHNMGFQEIDMTTGKPIFNWNPWSHGVSYNESCDTKGMHNLNEAWDWAHINSVDKNQDGDYLISIRHASAVYKISGQDGSVMWRLGGCYGLSDFDMEDGVAFHWQHHARFRFENETHTVLSLFDNSSEDWHDRNPDIPEARSAGKIIILDHKKHTAKMLRRFDRPDGLSSNALGSVQTLGDDVQTANVLVNWAWEGYISEYDAQDRLVMQAKFPSARHRSYRAYKYAWVGQPIDPPVLKVLPIGHSFDNVASAFYVSWNGATEVASWAFYGGNALNEPFQLLAMVAKNGFETSWVMAGAVKFAYAEALDAQGQVIGKSTTASIIPAGVKDFKFASPLLTNVVAFDAQPRVPSTGSLSVCRHVEGESTFWSISFHLLVDALALFGLFGVARKVLDEVLQRQNKGYRSVSNHDDESGGLRHGRPRMLRARLSSRFMGEAGWGGPRRDGKWKEGGVGVEEKEIHDLDWDQFCKSRYSRDSE